MCTRKDCTRKDIVLLFFYYNLSSLEIKIVTKKTQINNQLCKVFITLCSFFKKYNTKNEDYKKIEH